MTTKLITGGPVYTPAQVHQDGAVLIKDSTIRAVGPAGAFPTTDVAVTIDAGGRRIIPGLIDLHLHGFEGHDAVGPGLPEVIKALPAHGITAFLPTSYVAPRPLLREAIQTTADILHDAPPGAQVLGIHMEGPWFAPAKTGMANADLVYPLTQADVEEFHNLADGAIRMVTFAPEQGDAIEVIPWLVERGIIPAAGHTDADYDTIHRAVALGLNHATHTYNAMRGLHHREPGALGAVLDHDEIIAQLIADGQHVHAAAMRLLIRAKGIERVCVVSDAAPVTGLPPGEYQWEGYKLLNDGETSRLADGTLAGSVILINQMLRVLVEKTGLAFADALRMATRVPARLLGVRKGQLTPGYDADVVILGEDYQPLQTIIGGETVYRAP